MTIKRCCKRALPGAVVALALLVLSACQADGTIPPTYDTGPVLDQSVADTLAPDSYQPPQDTGPAPDTGPTPDTGPSPDGGLCGNKKVDSPAETCDKAIAKGKAGACPTAADCDDKNNCTTDSLKGSAALCSAECVNLPVANCCGNGTLEGSEACDDGNVVDKDGCSNLCKLPGGHLLITEVVTSPSEAEFIEIYNPSAATVALDKIYLTDRVDYVQLTEKGGPGGASSDFIARFPTGAALASGAYATVAIQGALKFKMTYGMAPDYELKADDSTVPDMVAPFTSTISSNAGLTDGNEFVMLFTWDGASDLVQDIDYVLWKSSGGTMVYKTAAVCIDGVDADTTQTCYKADTDVTKQSALQPASAGGSLHRCNYLEGTESQSGGNGITGHDETSEPLTSTWKRNPNTLKYRTPGATASVGFCPQ